MALLRKEEVERSATPPPPRDTEAGALLGRGTRFEGKLSFEGTVRIDGEFAGEVTSDGHLLVGESGRVEGDVKVGSAAISGQLKGSIQTAGALELASSARVTGDLVVESLVMARGAFLEGTVKMTRAQ